MFGIFVSFRNVPSRGVGGFRNVHSELVSRDFLKFSECQGVTFGNFGMLKVCLFWGFSVC